MMSAGTILDQNSVPWEQLLVKIVGWQSLPPARREISELLIVVQRQIFLEQAT